MTKKAYRRVYSNNSKYLPAAQLILNSLRLLSGSSLRWAVQGSKQVDLAPNNKQQIYMNK